MKFGVWDKVQSQSAQCIGALGWVWAVTTPSETVSARAANVLLTGMKVPHELAEPCRVPLLGSENLGLDLGSAEVR